jgi:hypothetical protein
LHPTGHAVASEGRRDRKCSRHAAARQPRSRHAAAVTANMLPTPRRQQAQLERWATSASPPHGSSRQPTLMYAPERRAHSRGRRRNGRCRPPPGSRRHRGIGVAFDRGQCVRGQGAGPLADTAGRSKPRRYQDGEDTQRSSRRRRHAGNGHDRGTDHEQQRGRHGAVASERCAWDKQPRSDPSGRARRGVMHAQPSRGRRIVALSTIAAQAAAAGTRHGGGGAAHTRPERHASGSGRSLGRDRDRDRAFR